VSGTIDKILSWKADVESDKGDAMLVLLDMI
jgi:hypothetical protein